MKWIVRILAVVFGQKRPISWRARQEVDDCWIGDCDLLKLTVE